MFAAAASYRQLHLKPACERHEARAAHVAPGQAALCRGGLDALCKPCQHLGINRICLGQPAHAVSELTRAERVDHRNIDARLMQHCMSEGMIFAGRFQRDQPRSVACQARE